MGVGLTQDLIDVPDVEVAAHFQNPARFLNMEAIQPRSPVTGGRISSGIALMLHSRAQEAGTA